MRVDHPSPPDTAKDLLRRFLTATPESTGAQPLRGLLSGSLGLRGNGDIGGGADVARLGRGF